MLEYTDGCCRFGNGLRIKYFLPLKEVAMRTLQMFFGVGMVVALLGANVAVADFEHRSLQPVRFSFDSADGTIVIPEFSFCDASRLGRPTEDAQATCAMTPGGIASSVMMELPVPLPAIVPRQEVVQPIAYSPGTLPGQRPFNEQRTYRSPTTTSTPPPQPDDERPPIEADVPEPATLLIVGLGVAGVAMARRKGRKV